MQQSVGPSLVQALTVSAQRHFSFGSLQATFARAQAKNRLTGQDIPEAPWLIWDVSASTLRLPERLRASGGFEYVGRKPLGDGFTAHPVREIRGSLTRSFRGELFEAGVHFLLANGYTGQTLETLQLPSETISTERVVGVRNQSYAGVSFIYHFKTRPLLEIALSRFACLWIPAPAEYRAHRSGCEVGNAIVLATDCDRITLAFYRKRLGFEEVEPHGIRKHCHGCVYSGTRQTLKVLLAHRLHCSGSGSNAAKL